MDNGTNISVTLNQPEDDGKSIVISFSTIFKYLKKYFLIWLIISVVIMFLLLGITMFLKSSTTPKKATALVSFNYEGIESGLDPDGNTFDVNKIKSPNIIETALTNIEVPLDNVEKIRSSITIKGIVSDNYKDQLSIYDRILEEGGNNSLTAADKLLQLSYNPTRFIVEFDYSKLNFRENLATQILNGILVSYQEYFFTEYGFNKSLGNSVVAIDYTEYDYPNAIDVLRSTLDTLDSYVTNLSSVNSTFRSGTTGYTFADLSDAISNIRSADLDSLSTYVTLNNVTSDKSYLKTYYEYRIEQLERDLSVYESELASIADSINNYEKDTMLILGEIGDGIETNYNQASAKYDDLIEQKVSKQSQYSKCKQDISYYEQRIKDLDESSKTASADNIAETEERLSAINDKINNLIELVNITSDEYYENVTFANAYNILVPATNAKPSMVTKDVMLIVIVVEVLVFVIYIVTSFIKALSSDYKAQKEREKSSLEEQNTKS